MTLAWAPLVVVGLGYALRIWRVSAFSITSDELDSLLFATLPLRDLFAALATHEPHPPFYYLFLHGWLSIFGQSELALRYPSVLFGTLGVAAGYNAGRTLGDRATGLAAAAIFATSQFAVLHAQEGRMYAALQAWAALFLAALLHYLRRPTRTHWAILALAGLLAAFTHYHGLLLVAVGVAPLLLATPVRSWPARLVPFAAIGVAYAPWIVFARRIVLDYRGWMAVVPPLEALRQSFVVYSEGVGVGGTAGRLALVVLPLFAVAGMATLATRRQWIGLATLVCLAILPLAMVVAGDATGRPLYNQRYLIVITPAYLTLAGAGLAALVRSILVRPVALAALVGLAVVSLPAYYWPAVPAAPDYRATVALITQEAGPDAAVVLPFPKGHSVGYYLKGRLPSYTAPDSPPPATVASDLAAFLAGRREVWFVRYETDPSDEAIAGWLEANAFFVSDRWVTLNHVLTYALVPPGSLAERTVGARVADVARIPTAEAGPDRVHPGARVLVGFPWSTVDGRPVPYGTKVSLRLIDPWGQTAAAFDRVLDNPDGLVHVQPLPIWHGALTVPPDAVPGLYHLEARFYDGASPRELAISDASGRQRAALELGTISVEPSEAAALSPTAPPDPSAVALGSGLYAEGVALSGAPYTQLAHLVASFDWASQANQTGPIVPELALQSAAGQIVASAARPEADQPYPLRQLRAGERVRERLDLSLHTVPASGTYRVVLRTAPARPWAVLGAISVSVDPALARSVPLAQTRSDLFDGVIRLVGTTGPTTPVPAGSTFTVDLGWYVVGHPTAQYTVFVHLVRGLGAPLAQSDALPGGQHTGDWLPGDYVVDTHQIAVPRTLPPGQYRLIAGLYEASSGRRADVVGPSADGQTVDLGNVVIAPAPGP